MAISHRSNRLKLKGSPSVEKLQNGRYKLTITCSTMNSREDWYSANKDRIFPDFGDLQSAAINNIDGLSPRSGEAYTDMKLTEVQSGNRSPRDGEDYIIIFVYETLGSSFVSVQDDTVTLAENGLRRVTRKSIAEAGTDFQKTIGSSSISSQLDNETAVVCKLASYEVNDTDSYREVTEVYIEPGIVSTVEDFEGSQKTVIQETFSQEPDTPTGFSKAREEVSNADGIPTNRYTFLKDNVVLSETKDKVGSQLAIVKEVFNGTPSTPSGYSIANERESNVDGIPTKQFTFLKNDVQLAQSEDKVGSQLAISQQWFNPSSDKTVSGYSLASQNTSDFEGIKTIEYRFLKEDVQLSQSEDEVGSQNSITEEWFKPSASRKTKTNYSLARKDESNVQGIPTEQYTFLKDDVELSRIEDKVGSQLSIVTEVFKPTADPTESGYSVAKTEVSDVEGIPTKRFTFLKDDAELSKSEDNVGSQLAIIIESFNPTTNPEEPGYSVARTEVSNVDGIPTKRFTFLKDDVELSRSEDKVGSQLSITTEVFNPTSDPTETGYSVARTEVSDVEGIPTKRFTFLKDDVELSRREDKVESELAIVTEVFNPTADPTESGYSIAREEVSDVDGIPTKRFTLLKNNAELSRNEDKVGSQLAITTEVFNPDSDPTESGYVLARTNVSDVDGIPTKRFTFLKENVTLATSIDKRKGDGTTFALIRESIEMFKPTGTPTPETTGAVLVGEDVSDVDGIPTKRFTFAKGDGEIIVDKRPGPTAFGGCTEVTVTTIGSSQPTDPTGTIIARTETENDGYKTFRVTAIQGQITGQKQTYKDIVTVELPGEVNLTTEDVSIVDSSNSNLGLGNLTGNIALPKVKPVRSKKIAATVTVEITDTPPDTAALAYDLGEISCSVTSLNLNYSSKVGPTKRYKVGIFITPKTDWQRSYSPSARIQNYPGCFLSGNTESTGEVSYNSQKFHQLEPDEDEDGFADGLESTINSNAMSVTKCIGEGSTSSTGFQETGIIKRNSRPILTDLDEKTYYEVITWSI